MRLCCAATLAANACGVPTVVAAPQREAAHWSSAPLSDPSVLRQPVSLPLEALVEPFDLATWLMHEPGRPATDAARPAANPRTTDNPFVDDPPEAADDRPPFRPGTEADRRAPGPAVPSQSGLPERLPAHTPPPLVRPNRLNHRPDMSSTAAPDDTQVRSGSAPAEFESPSANANSEMPQADNADDHDEDPFAF